MLDYRPDLDPRTPGVLTGLTDMVPTERGYRNAYTSSAHTAVATYSPAANETYPNVVFASRWLSTPGGIVFVGTNKKINVYDYTNGFVDVTNTATYGGDYALNGQAFQFGEDSPAAFDFCAYGDVVIACNKTVNTQKRTALDLTNATKFTDLANAPDAATCCVARNFLFLGNCGDWSTVTGASNILGWSAVGDYTDWTVNPTVTQASYAQFSDTPGPITCVRPFRDGIVVFKADAMYYGRYVGAGTNSDIWDFERISDKIGCVGNQSVRNIDTALVFVGRDDVYIFDGTRPQSITRGIYTVLQPNLTLNGGGNSAMHVGHDKLNWCIWLSAGSTTYVWNYKFNRWGKFANGGTPVYCDTNADDFRKKTVSTVTAGVQSYTTTTDHYNLYTMVFVSGAPKNFNTTRSTAATMTTGYTGDPVKLRTLTRVNIIFASAPSSLTVPNISVTTSRFPGGGTASANVTMNASHRMDMLGTAAMTNNFFSFQFSSALSCEVMDIVPTLVPAGER